jgi:glucokinase
MQFSIWKEAIYNTLNYVIGIDLGGTNLKIGAILADGEVLYRKRIPSGVEEGRDVTIKRLLYAVEEVRFHVKGKRLAGIGLGIAGAILVKKGVVVQAPNLPGWEDFNIKEELTEKLQWPLFIDNDANAFAIGEGWRGAARYSNNFCCITLGTGIGGGIVLNGELWHGIDGTAGEIGHMIVEPEGIPCNCGGNGCLEMYASARALVRMAKEGKNDMTEEIADNITADDIARLARSGIPYYNQIFLRLAGYLGIGMADLVNLLNVEMIVIGGGLSKSCDLFLDTAREVMLRRSFKVAGERVKVLPAELGVDGGMLGSGFLAFKGLGLL